MYLTDLLKISNAKKYAAPSKFIIGTADNSNDGLVITLNELIVQKFNNM